jgi:hypothetical protein
MSIDPRRSRAALWVAWLVAGGLGGGAATLLPLALVNPPDSFWVPVYFAAFSAIAALFQFLVLKFVAPKTRAVLLWLPATVVGVAVLYPLLDQLVFAVSNLTGMFMFAYDGTWLLSLGLAQGLVLTVMTGRKTALAIWVGGILLALPVSDYFAHLYVPLTGGVALVVSNAMSHGAEAALTGVALILILDLGRRARQRAQRAAPAPQGLS